MKGRSRPGQGGFEETTEPLDVNVSLVTHRDGVRLAPDTGELLRFTADWRHAVGTCADSDNVSRKVRDSPGLNLHRRVGSKAAGRHDNRRGRLRAIDAQAGMTS